MKAIEKKSSGINTPKSPEDGKRFHELDKELRGAFDQLTDYLAPPESKTGGPDMKTVAQAYANKNPLYDLAKDTSKTCSELVPYISNKYKSRILEKNSDDETPIDVAIKNGNIPFLQILFGPRKYDNIIDLPQLSKWEEGCILKRAIDALAGVKDSEVIGRFSQVATLIGGAALTANDLSTITQYIEDKMQQSQDVKLKEALGSLKERLPQLPVERQLQKSIIAHKTQMLVIQERDKLEKTILRPLRNRFPQR